MEQEEAPIGRHRLRHGDSSLDLWSAVDVAPSDVRDNVLWPCVVVFVTSWLLVTIVVVLGVCGTSTSLELGPNYSRLFTPNPLFVQSFQAKQIEGIPGPMLYGLHTSPSLDVKTTWIQTHSASIQPNFHKEWIYYLNIGSKLDISYRVNSLRSNSLILAIAKGKVSLKHWIEEPTNPNSTLSWNKIYGSGRIEHEVTASTNYYIAVGNSYSDTNLEVELNITIRTLLYNISQAYIRCSLYDQVCSFSIMFRTHNVLLLTSPGPQQATIDDVWYIKLSYGPRWVSYITISGFLAMTIFIVIKFHYLCRKSHVEGERTVGNHDNQETFLSTNDNDNSSWGSSYDSTSNDDDDNFEDTELNPLMVCGLCFNSPRDCFFLPCGHCAVCLMCGSRIIEEAGCCLVCQRRIKKVRKIILV